MLIHAADLPNHPVSSALNKMKLYESLLGRAANSSKLRIFGCTAFVYFDKAMENETVALRDLQCWKEIPRPWNEHILPTKFVLGRKRNRDGDVEKFKARLVVLRE